MVSFPTLSFCNHACSLRWLVLRKDGVLLSHLLSPEFADVSVLPDKLVHQAMYNHCCLLALACGHKIHSQSLFRHSASL